GSANCVWPVPRGERRCGREPGANVSPCVRGASLGRNSGAERGKCDWWGGLTLREAGNRRRFLRDNRCNRSSEGVASDGGVAAEAPGASIWESSGNTSMRSNDPSKQVSIGRPSRRRLLQVGGIGMLGLALPELLLAPVSGRTTRRGGDRSCIFIVQQGGASHVDTWDTKPGAPPGIRGPYKPIATRV